MALEKIRPRVIDETGNYTFNNVTTTGSLISGNASIGNITGITNLVASTTTITVTGNLSTDSNVSAGNIKTNNLLYANGNPWSIGASSTPPGGSTTQVQFNDVGSFNGSSSFTFDKSTNTLLVTNISANGAQLSSLTASNITGQVSNALVSETVYANAQPNITSVGTLTSLTVTSNITSGNANLGNATTSNYFIGNGSLLSSITGGNVTGQVAYAAVANSVSGSNVVGQVTFAATANAVAGSNVMGTVSSATTAGTVTTAAQPNITSVGTLTNLNVTGNVSAAYFIGDGSQLTNIPASGITGSYSNTNVAAYLPTHTGNINANVFNGNGESRFWDGTYTDPDSGVSRAIKVGNRGIAILGGTKTDTLTATGNASASYFIGNGYYLTGVDQLSVGNADGANYIANGTSKINTPVVNGNITVNVGATTNVAVFTSTGVNIAGHLTATANVTGSFIKGNGYYLTGVDQLAAGSADVANSIANGTSNINTPASGGNITVGIGGTSNTVIFTSTGVNIAGYISPSTGSGSTNGIVWPSNPGGGTLDVASIKYYAVTGEQTRLEINVQNDTPGSTQDDIYFTTNSYVVVNNSTEATSTSSAPFQVLGGAGIAKKLFVGGNIEAGTNYIKGNGYFLTGVDQLAAGSADVANSIANGTSNVNTPVSGGNVTVSIGGTSNTVVFTNTGVNIAGHLTATANVTGSFIKGNGFYLTGISAGSGTYSNTDVAGYLPTYTGNITAGNANLGNAVVSNYFIGNGALLTGIDTSNTANKLANGTSNVNIPAASGNVTFGVGGSGNIVIVTSTGLVVTGSGSISVAGGTVTGGALTGPLTTAAQPNITSLGTLTALNVSGTITHTGGNANLGNVARANYFIGDGSLLSNVITGVGDTIANLTSNITVLSTAVTLSANGTANVLVILQTGANINGYANITGNATIGNITTSGIIVSSIATGTAPLTVTSTTRVANLNVANSGYSDDAGNVVNATQPNITSLGTLANLTVNGLVDLGTASNIKIGGGAANYFLKTDGSGNLSWAVPAGGGGGGGTSLTYTAGTAPPGSGNILGDQWFNTSANVLYEYISDGTASYWVDISGATTTTTTPTTLDLANVTIAGGSSGQAIVSNGAGGLSFANLTQSNIYNGNSNVTVVANSSVNFNISGTANVLTVTSTGANLVSTGTANLGNLATANYFTGTLTTGAQPNITSVGTLTGLNIAGTLTYNAVLEPLVYKTGATGTVVHDVSQAATFYHESMSSNFTASFSNVSTVDARITVVSLILVQGSTAYVPAANVIINGNSQTVKWYGNAAPSGTASSTDVLSYTFIKANNNFTAFGQFVTFT